ncbi:MAG: cytochrome c3 family protein [Bdellovibrionales bacterium]
MQQKGIKIVIGLVMIMALGGFAWLMTPPVGYNNGYQPKQPIPYDHSLHAGKYQIQCQYCHSNVEFSKHSSVPSLNVCLNCHNQIKTDSPHIQRIREAHDSGESIEWVKIHMLPDFVHFNHKRHVRKGVSCQTCHGPIEEMVEVYQYSDLSMGWCINCHRKPENNAPVTCSTCHY